jgi:hypothetical protein
MLLTSTLGIGVPVAAGVSPAISSLICHAVLSHRSTSEDGSFVVRPITGFARQKRKDAQAADARLANNLQVFHQTSLPGYNKFPSIFSEVKKVTIYSIIVVAIGLMAYALAQWRMVIHVDDDETQRPASLDSLPALDVSGVVGVREITKSELLTLMSKNRALSRTEKAQIGRGCPGFTCLYQSLGLTRWPESARSARAYLRLENALNRRCPENQENFVFVKQAWWTSGKPPTPDARSGEVPLSSVTRLKPGWYTFNYAVYFPTTKTYAWINHREYGFPTNLLWPMEAYLSLSPPPIDENRPAQLYCSTCR